MCVPFVSDPVGAILATMGPLVKPVALLHEKYFVSAVRFHLAASPY